MNYLAAILQLQRQYVRRSSIFPDEQKLQFVLHLPLIDTQNRLFQSPNKYQSTYSQYCYWKKSPDIIIKQVFICSKPYIYTKVDRRGAEVFPTFHNNTTQGWQIIKFRTPSPGYYLGAKKTIFVLYCSSSYIHVVSLSLCFVSLWHGSQQDHPSSVLQGYRPLLITHTLGLGV